MNLFPLLGILLIFLLVVFLISVINNTRMERKEEREQEIEELDNLIQVKQSLINNLNQQYETSRIDKKVSLSSGVNKVLDIYEQSNIQIPADIIEELSINQFQTEKEIFDYIENQRYYWKLENTKKPYKKVK